jgi:3-hydroxyacyl-[acyl-carrier-protein] dehydratase
MILLNRFYSISNHTITSELITADVSIDPNHFIFEGHFPGNPITPGVTQLEIIKDLIAISLEKKVALKKMGNCKFLAVLNPNVFAKVTVQIAIKEQNEESVSISATIVSEEVTFLKLSAQYHFI